MFLLVSIRFIPNSFLYFFQQPPRKHGDQSALQVSFDDKSQIYISFSDLRNDNGIVNYYFEVDLNF